MSQKLSVVIPVHNAEQIVTDTLNCPEIANLICHDPANVRDIKCISHTQMTASLVNRDSRHLLFWVFQ